MLIFDAPPVVNIDGENGVAIEKLPSVWQEIAASKAHVGMENPQDYVKMAQLFQYKLASADVDLFAENPNLTELQPFFSQLFGKLAQETLEFYGSDFLVSSYPDFQQILEHFESQGNGGENQLKVVNICQELFTEFGYSLPASFYHVHLAPVYREHVFEERALRFDPRDREYKRPYDAILHAGKVFAIQMKIQSIASRYGFTYHHGCGCNSHLASIDESLGAFDYELDEPKRQRWIRSFIWTTWYEYAFFPIVPNTKYLV